MPRISAPETSPDPRVAAICNKFLDALQVDFDFSREL
jgi:hypothetical protein